MEFLEEARYDLLDPHEDLLLTWKEKGVLLFIVNININYLQPAFLGDLLRVETGISKIGRKSGIIHQEIWKKGSKTPIINADVTFVAMNTRTGKAMPFEAELHSCIQAIAGPARPMKQ